MHYVVQFLSAVIFAGLLHQVLKEESCWTETQSQEKPEDPDLQSSLPYKTVDAFATPPGDEDESKELFQEREITDRDISTSVWCHGNSSSHRSCKFQNLCYHSSAESFVFFSGEETVVENLSESDLELSVLDLSSVSHHSAHYLTLTTLPGVAWQKFSASWITRQALAFSRFKPDNLMHVLHDDILPLHNTLSMISKVEKKTGRYNVQLVFLEGWEPEQYINLYRALSNYPTLFLKQELNTFSDSDLVCFESIYVGISKSTVWYQYGFFEPQGPVKTTKVTANHIHRTSQFLQQQLPPLSDDNLVKFLPDYVILLCRKENRLILNQAELRESIARDVKTAVVHLDEDLYSLSDMIHLVSKAKGIVGMHGALMSLVMFLPGGSFVLELFPFGVNPDHYTPYKTLSELPGMNLIYKSWRNIHADKTVSFPNRHPKLGGIQHLNPKEQTIILSEREVKRHLCCEDASWLFHIYQDTVVDIEEISTILTSLKKQVEKSSTKRIHSHKAFEILPSKVQYIQCMPELSDDGEITLVVIWQEPWNVHYVTFHKLHYEVLVKTEGSDDHVKYLVSRQKLELPFPPEEGGSYILWIRAVLDDRDHGPYTNMVHCGS